MKGNGTRECLNYCAFVLEVSRAAVIREKRDFATRIELAQQVIGPNLPAGIDRQELACFDP
jgi:hypothetical protein